MSKGQLILIIIYYLFFCQVLEWFTSNPKFQSNLIFIIRYFSLYLTEKIFENFTADLSFFELSRYKTVMYFAIERKGQRKHPADFTLFHLKSEKF